jgi:hypothetical protein
VTACGCVTLPEALIMMPGKTLAYCNPHGYQPIVRKWSLREQFPQASPPDEPLY